MTPGPLEKLGPCFLVAIFLSSILTPLYECSIFISLMRSCLSRHRIMAPTPITIVTGFLGSGKTTLILNLIPQLPMTYKLALLKNEFGDLAVDSQLAASSSIAGVRELLNGCICCNLVGQLGDALETLRAEQRPDRIIIETSGSAFPATIALEVNRLASEANGENFVLDGVISVIDVENWEGYDDTSVTAKMQAKYTDFVVFNKWEDVSERRFDECLDRLGDLDLQTPYVKTAKGVVNKDLVLGIDGALASSLDIDPSKDQHDHGHDGKEHQSEVEVLSVTLDMPCHCPLGVDLSKLDQFLESAPRDEIYRIKGILWATSAPRSSGEEQVTLKAKPNDTSRYILNWAFGRWTYTPLQDDRKRPDIDEAALRLTIIFARYESNKWRKRLEQDNLLTLEHGTGSDIKPKIARIT